MTSPWHLNRAYWDPRRERAKDTSRRIHTLCQHVAGVEASGSLWNSHMPTQIEMLLCATIVNLPARWSSCKVPQHPAVFVVLLFIDRTDVTKTMSSSTTKCFFFFLFLKTAIHTGVSALSCHVGWFQTMSADSQTAVDEGGSCHSLSLSFLSEASCVWMSHCYLCIMPTTCSQAPWLPLQWPWLTRKPGG